MADQGTDSIKYRVVLPRQSNNTASDGLWNPEDMKIIEDKHEKKKKKMEEYRKKMKSF